jgi:hypothetical protein
MLLRSPLHGLALNLSVQYNSTYSTSMGAIPVQLGILQGAGNAAGALVSLFAGWFIDRNSHLMGSVHQHISPSAVPVPGPPAIRAIAGDPLRCQFHRDPEIEPGGCAVFANDRLNGNSLDNGEPFPWNVRIRVFPLLWTCRIRRSSILSL